MLRDSGVVVWWLNNIAVVFNCSNTYIAQHFQPDMLLHEKKFVLRLSTKRVSPEEEAIAVQRAADAMSELLFSTENPAAPVARGRAARLQPPQKKD